MMLKVLMFCAALFSPDVSHQIKLVILCCALPYLFATSCAASSIATRSCYTVFNEKFISLYNVYKYHRMTVTKNWFMKKICWFLLAIPLVILRPLGAEISDSRFLQPVPSDDWYTLETDHFRINFQSENTDYAERLARIAERQHDTLTQSLGWFPTGKTEIVVNDKVDYSNGASTAYPYNQFYVYLNEPVEGTLKDHIDFAETLFTHEYTHILQMDQARGRPSKIRRLFGKSPNGLLVAFTMPQMLAPHWVSEGIAIYSESMSGFGRNNSSVFNAMMREEVATGLASFKEESYEGYYGSRWPFAQVYLYGAYFYQFLLAEYGEPAVTAYIDHYSDNLIPWKMNERARRTTGKSAEVLWQEFQAYLRARFGPEIESRNKEGLSKGEVLFDEHWQNRLITAGPEGSVYFYHKDQLQTPTVMQLLPNGESKSVLALKGITSLKWHPVGGLLIARMGVCENSSLFADLYRYDIKSKALKRITECARTPRAAWAPDGQSVFAVRTSGAYNLLVNVSLNGDMTVLDKLKLGESIGFPAVSANGRSIVVPVKRQLTGWNLESFEVATKQWTPLTADSAIYSSPFFSADQSEVCFTSDISDSPELHCLDVNTGKQTAKTRSRGFINEATFSTDGDFWVSEYTADGDVIRKLQPSSSYAYDDGASSSDKRAVLSMAGSLNTEQDLPDPTPYRASKTLRPRGWAPLFFGSNDSSALGLTVAGSDVLGFHNWAVSPLFFRQNDKSHPGGVITYSYNDRLSLLMSDQWSLAYGNDEGEARDEPTAEEETVNIQMLGHSPVNKMDWSMDLFAGVAFEMVRKEQIPRRGKKKNHQDLVTGLGFSFNNFDHYAHAITEGSGIALQLQLESFDWLSSTGDYSGLAGVLMTRGNFRFGKNQTLSIKVDAGAAEEGGKPFVLGGSTDVVDSLTGISRLGQREFSLRGYSAQQALSGTRFTRGSLAWHMPILSLYNGFSSVPLGLGKLSNTLFVEAGDAWRNASDRELLTSVGIELNAEILIGFDSLLLPVAFGVASGLDKDLGENQFYMKLSIDY